MCSKNWSVVRNSLCVPSSPAISHANSLLTWEFTGGVNRDKRVCCFMTDIASGDKGSSSGVQL